MRPTVSVTLVSRQNNFYTENHYFKISHDDNPVCVYRGFFLVLRACQIYAYLPNIINTNTVIVRGGCLVGECNFQVLLSKLYYVQKAIWCCVYHECIHNGPNITQRVFLIGDVNMR